MRFHDFSNFIAFQDMLKCADSDVERFQSSQQSEYLVLSIAVTMNPTLLLKNFNQCIEFEISSRRHAFSVGTPIDPAITILSRREEGITNNLFDAHSSLRITRCILISPIGLFYIFAKSKLNPFGSFREFQLLWVSTPPKFDNLVLSSDRIR